MDSSVVILSFGDSSEKLINEQRGAVTPFVGINGEGRCAQFGIGLLLPKNERIFWGSIPPHSLLQSWRGMKIIEQAYVVKTSETLCACFSVARNNINNAANLYLDTLARSFGGIDALQNVRHEILGSFPTSHELETMIVKLKEHNVPIDTREIEEAVSVGHISENPTIMEMIKLNRELFSRAVLGFR